MPRITVDGVVFRAMTPGSAKAENKGLRLNGTSRITGSTEISEAVFDNSLYAPILYGNDLEQVSKLPTRFTLGSSAVFHIDGGTVIQPIARYTLNSGSDTFSRFITLILNSENRHIMVTLQGAGGSGASGGRGSDNGGGGGGAGALVIGVVKVTRSNRNSGWKLVVGSGGSAVPTNTPKTNGSKGGDTMITGGGILVSADGGSGGRSGGGNGAGGSTDTSDLLVTVDNKYGAVGGANGNPGANASGSLSIGNKDTAGFVIGSGGLMANFYSGGTKYGYDGGSRSSVHSTSNRSREGGGGGGSFFGRGGSGANSGGGSGETGAGGAGSASRSGLVHTGPSGAGGSGKAMIFY